MSVGASFEYALRPFASDFLPGSPGGIWGLNGEVEGDASGGVRSLTHLFQVLPTIQNSNFYSIEQVDVSDTLTTQTQIILQANGMDAIWPGQQTAALNQVFRRMQLTDISGIGGPQVASKRWEQVASRPWFIGQPSRNPSLSALFVATVDNADSEVLRVRLQGYWWPPGAMNEVGGLKRPLGSIFGD